MKTLPLLGKIALVSFAVSSGILACSSSDTSSSSSSGGTTSSTSSSSGGTSGSSTTSTSSGGSSGSSGGGACGSETCTATQYCRLTGTRASSSGDIEWKPSQCKDLPSGCTVTNACTSCIIKSSDCPQNGVVSSKCSITNGVVQAGCETL